MTFKAADTCSADEAMQILRTSRKQIFRLIKSGALIGYKEEFKGRGRYVLDRASVLARAAQRSERETLGAPEPIFTTDDDFVTATLKLKRLRRYEQD